MSFEPFKRLTGKTLVLAQDNIDTDQIIPARFLTTTARDGLGAFAFYDWRFTAEGDAKPNAVLPAKSVADTPVLVAGRNFGCGSSREHAPWALLDYGVKAVISTEIADIFRSNSLKNGLLPIVVDQGTLDWLMENPGSNVEIDVVNSALTLPNGQIVNYPIDAFARHCLVEGIDQLGFLQQSMDAIRKYEESRP